MVMAGISKSILAMEDAVEGLAGVVRAGPLLFTAGCDGHRDLDTRAIIPALAGNAEDQCENAYGGIERLLRRGGCGPDAIVRLDHVTSSQDWLPRRQAIRQKHFGRPAPLASTGVAARMEGINMLSACAIAVADPTDKEVLVSGPKYGMQNISSLVRGGPFLFVSGIRGTTDPRSGRALPEETAESFAAQTRTAFEIITAILGEAHAGADRILRLDCHIRDINRAGEEAALRTSAFPELQCASTVVGLPLGARGEVEVTALALAPGHGAPLVHAAGDSASPSVIGAAGFLFVGECRASRPAPTDRSGQLEAALNALETALRRARSDLSHTVRLDLYLRDIHFARAARAQLLRRFRGSPPVVFVTGADLEDLLEVKLGAIALQGG